MLSMWKNSSTPEAPTPVAEPPPGGRGFSYRARLVAGVCGLVLLTGAAITWLAYRSARDSTRALADSIFREVSGHTVTHTRAFVLRAAPLVESLAQLADNGLALDDPERLTPQLLAVLKANPGLSWISYSDESGSFTGANRTPEGGLRINRSRIRNGKTQLVEYDALPDGSLKEFHNDPDSGYDPRARPFYIAAKQKGRLVWLPPYVFYWQWVPGTTCAVPVKDPGGKLRGVLTADFDLNALTDFVSRLSVSEHSRVFLFTSDEILLAHPDRRAVSGTRETAKLLTLADAGDPLVDAYRANLRPEYLKPADGQEFHRFEFRHDDTEYLGSATTFRLGDDLTWVVGAVAPKADFLSGVWQSQVVALLAAGGALLAAVLLAFALARSVSGPVLKLTGFMRRVGGGDLEAKAELGGSREFRELSGALNSMIGDLRDRLRLRHSLDVAMQVQQRLLPNKPPEVRGLDVAGHSTYCDETGGDYYDFLLLDEAALDCVLVALGDVMGHGVAAALVMAGARAVLRDRADDTGSLASLMGRLNHMLASDLGGERFMTMHLSMVNARERTFRWVSAGHDPAIIYDPAADRFEEIDVSGLPLGVLDDISYEESTYGPLKPGQVITVGTDGVWEMPNAAGEQFGKERLRAVIRSAAGGTADGIVRAIVESLNKFRGDFKAVDDVTFVVIKVAAAQEKV
jgi:sigma-B regulation protein RsbU (phosphoserine phosphatase)